MSIFKKSNSTTAEKIINLALFIVPNPAFQLSPFKEKDFSENRSEKVEEARRLNLSVEDVDTGYNYIGRIKNFFGEGYVKPYETFTQVWIADMPDVEEVSDNESNYVDGFCKREWNVPFERFHHDFPSKWLEGLNEGDSFYLETKDNDGKEIAFKITVLQEKYRYERFGRFEKVFQKVNSNPTFAYRARD